MLLQRGVNGCQRLGGTAVELLKFAPVSSDRIAQELGVTLRTDQLAAQLLPPGLCQRGEHLTFLPRCLRNLGPSLPLHADLGLVDLAVHAGRFLKGTLPFDGSPSSGADLSISIGVRGTSLLGLGASIRFEIPPVCRQQITGPTLSRTLLRLCQLSVCAGHPFEGLLMQPESSLCFSGQAPRPLLRGLKGLP
ncbi:hypothetical protein AB0I84_07505 [Streptomyces spectabilis]|uniref:hypothetical protein n=1 Tax=Streptomyces spectabilis TaxID=68270 RepID=UPI00340A00D8